MKKIRGLLKKFHFSSEYVTWLANYTKPFIGRILLLLLIGIISSSISVALAVLSKKVIDSAIAGSIDIKDIYLYVVLIVVTIMAAALGTLISVVLDERFSFGIRKQLYEKIIGSTWLDVTKYHTGDLMTRLTSDAGNIAEGIVFTLPNIINLLVQMIITFVVLFYYEPLMALFALIIGPVAAIITFVVGRKLKRLQVRVQETEANYRSFLQESLSHLLIVKAFCNEAYSTNKLVDLREDRFYWVKKKAELGIISSSAMSFTFQIGYIAAFAFGSFQVASGMITFGTMTVFITLVNKIQAPIFQLARNIPQIVSMLASVGRVIEVQQITIEEKSESHITQKNIGVDLTDISFGYDQDGPLFESTSTTIEPGEFIAVVGESGIGKTTLIRLIMSFLNTDTGRIEFFNDLGQREAVNACAREYISYVPQGNTLFSGTIRENVRMGDVLATEEEIMEALKLASAYEFVKTLPHGIDTIIGEKAHGISEGQAQRIAIARALVRKAPFLILDEATSSLDDQTELDVLKKIRKLDYSPTCLMITHRHSILDYCDKELKIQDKKMMLRALR